MTFSQSLFLFDMASQVRNHRINKPRIRLHINTRVHLRRESKGNIVQPVKVALPNMEKRLKITILFIFLNSKTDVFFRSYRIRSDEIITKIKWFTWGQSGKVNKLVWAKVKVYFLLLPSCHGAELYFILIKIKDNSNH